MTFLLLASSEQYQSALHPTLACSPITQAVHAGYVAEGDNGIGAVQVSKTKHLSVLLFCLAITFWAELPALAEESRTAGDERYNRPAGCLVAQVRLPMQMEIHGVDPKLPCIEGTENEEIIAKCSPGTVIELPVEATCSIEQLCDFSKAIFNTTTKKTLCVMRQH
jgi:hypothetical protein